MAEERPGESTWHAENVRAAQRLVTVGDASVGSGNLCLALCRVGGDSRNCGKNTARCRAQDESEAVPEVSGGKRLAY